MEEMVNFPLTKNWYIKAPVNKLAYFVIRISVLLILFGHFSLLTKRPAALTTLYWTNNFTSQIEEMVNFPLTKNWYIEAPVNKLAYIVMRISVLLILLGHFSLLSKRPAALHYVLNK